MTTFVITFDHDQPKPYTVVKFVDGQWVSVGPAFAKSSEALMSLPERVKQCKRPPETCSLGEVHSCWRIN